MAKKKQAKLLALLALVGGGVLLPHTSEFLSHLSELSVGEDFAVSLGIVECDLATGVVGEDDEIPEAFGVCEEEAGASAVSGAINLSVANLEVGSLGALTQVVLEFCHVGAAAYDGVQCVVL